MVIIKPVVALVCMCGWIAAAPDIQAANLVSNPGFETGDFTGWSLSGTDSAPDDNGIYYGVDIVDAHSGTYGAFFGPVGGVLNLSQTLSTVSGTPYTISFWLQETPGTISPYTNSFTASFGTSTLLSLSDTSNFSYTFYSFNAVSGAGLTPLVFGFRDDVGFFSFDDVSVTGATSVAPEPSSFGLMLAALLLLLGVVLGTGHRIPARAVLVALKRH